MGKWQTALAYAASAKPSLLLATIVFAWGFTRNQSTLGTQPQPTTASSKPFRPLEKGNTIQAHLRRDDAPPQNAPLRPKRQGSERWQGRLLNELGVIGDLSAAFGGPSEEDAIVKGVICVVALVIGVNFLGDDSGS